MKLLIATDSFLPRWDGIARFLDDLLPELVEDHTVTAIAPAFEGRSQKIKDVNVVRVRLLGFGLGDYKIPVFPFKKMRQLVKEADLVWTQTIGPIGATAIHYSRRYNKPVLAFVHSLEWELVSKSLTTRKMLQPIIGFLMRTIMRKLYNRCRILLVPSVEVAEKLNALNIKTRKKVVRLGVDTTKFVPPKDKSLSKRALNINPECIVIGFSGRLGREKGLTTLYKAFKRLKYDNIRLLLIGRGVRELEKLFAHDKRIRQIKYTNRMRFYLQAMDIYVMPSFTETSSLSTMEAMSCGLPIIATKVGLMKRYIKERENGFFFPQENYTVLSIKLSRLMKDQAARERLGKRARQTIIEKYDWQNTVKKIKEVLGSAN